MLENEFRLITPIPDDNTCEAIVFGSAYKFAKSSKFFWDAVEDLIRKEIEALKGQLKDKEFCAYVLNSPGLRSMIYRKSPPVSEPDKIKDLWTLRRISNLCSGLVNLDAMRKQNVMWSSMTGVREYTAKLMDSGISDSQWKVAADGIDMPIEYETVRAILEGDEAESMRDADRISEDMEAHRRECEQFERDLENYRRLREAEPDDDAEVEDDDLPELRIFREVEEDEDNEEDGEDEESETIEIPEPTYYPLDTLMRMAVSEWLNDDIERFIQSLQAEA